MAVAALVGAAPIADTPCFSDTDCQKALGGPNFWCNVSSAGLISCGNNATDPCFCTNVAPPCAGHPYGVFHGAEDGRDCVLICSQTGDDEHAGYCNPENCIALLGNTSPPWNTKCGEGWPRMLDCPGVCCDANCLSIVPLCPLYKLRSCLGHRWRNEWRVWC